MQLDEQEKQGLALAKLLDIMNLDRKTVRDWPVCQRSHTFESNLALRDAKIVAMEQSISQFKHAVRDLQQRSWQPMLIINMPDMQRPIKFLGSYTMSH